MSDLISRADAICEVLVNDGINNIVDRINALPSAEAVEVVRCKDCKHWHEWENATGSCFRSENGCNWFGTDAIDYCSFGERKNDSE